MAYVYKAYLVVKADAEDIHVQEKIDLIMDRAFNGNPIVEIVGTKICEIVDNNCGRCCKCGSWVSDQEKANCIDGFSDGCIINGNWWCDLCIDENHPKSFR